MITRYYLGIIATVMLALSAPGCSNKKMHSNLHQPQAQKTSIQQHIALLESGKSSSCSWYLSELIESLYSNDKNAPKVTLFGQKTHQEAAALKTEISNRLISYERKQDYASNALSFLCLVINAHDATVNKSKRYGKSGVGFFEALRFLSFNETNGCTITITSRYSAAPNNHLEFNIQLAQTTHPITHKADVLVVVYDVKKLTDLTPGGTIVSITPNNTKTMFCEEMRDELAAYLHNGYQSRDVAVIIKTLGEQTIIGEARTQPRVVVSLLPTELRVQDFGRGISIYKALTRLLIPGGHSSTNKRP